VEKKGVGVSMDGKIASVIDVSLLGANICSPLE